MEPIFLTRAHADLTRAGHRGILYVVPPGGIWHSVALREETS